MTPRDAIDAMRSYLDIQRQHDAASAAAAKDGPKLIKAVLAHTGVTQRVLAHAMGIHEVHLCNIKRGKGEMSLQFAANLSDACAVLSNMQAEKE